MRKKNAYGMSKLGQEMVAINLGRRYGIPSVALSRGHGATLLNQFLPGPASSQVGFSLGLMRAGYLGGLAAWARGGPKSSSGAARRAPG